MVSTLVPGASIAFVRPPLPLPDASADALWALSKPMHHGEPRRFLALASSERHWRLLADLQAIEPTLATLGFAVGAELIHANTERPVRALRHALSRLGVHRTIWRHLVRYRLDEARRLFARSGAESLVAHLRLSSAHGELLPFDGPLADWAVQFQLPSINSSRWHLATAGWLMTPAMAIALFREGARRLEAGSFAVFSEEELPVVAAWRDHLGKGAPRAKWSTLLARASAAEKAKERSLTAKDQRWDTGMDRREFAGLHVTALSDGVALWREGLRMHHCVGDYAQRCLDGVNRIFHLDTGDDSRGWTLALLADGEGGWEVDDLRGVSNALPPAPLTVWAEEWAREYGDIFPSDPSARDDERPEICGVCREEWCDTHLVLYADCDEGIIQGAFQDADKDLEVDVRSAIGSLLLAGQAPPPHWPSEWTSLYKELARIPRDELFDLIDDDDGPRWEAGDAFEDEWSNCGGRRAMTKWIEEWAMAQSETVAKYTEVATAPGLSWAGWNVYASDPKLLLARFNAHVARLLHGKDAEVGA